MDDVEAAIQALEWGKNEFLGHGVSPSSLPVPTSPGNNIHTMASSSTATATEAALLSTVLSRTRVELEATKRRCHELQTERDVHRHGRAATERDLLVSRTAQTEQTAQLHSEIRSLQQQLWQTKQEVEHWRAKEQQSQAQLHTSVQNVEQLRTRLSTADRDNVHALKDRQRKLAQALAERDAAVLEARQMKMQRGNSHGSANSGSANNSSGKTIITGVGGADLDVDSLPQQVAQRLRQAAQANEELVQKLDQAEAFAHDTKMLVDTLNATKMNLEQRETQLRAFEIALHQALSQPQKVPSSSITTTTQTSSSTAALSSSRSPTSPRSPRSPRSPAGFGRGVDLAKRAEVVASSASNMLHLLTSKHASLLSRVSELRARLDDAQNRLTSLDSRHATEVEGMEEAHKKILSRLADMSMEATGLSRAVKRSTHAAVEKAVEEMVGALQQEKRQRKEAETKMKKYRARVDEWENALNDANDRAADAGRAHEKLRTKHDKLKEGVKRAKSRISKLETDRESLRGVIRSNRYKEAQLAEQAATQAEIQVRFLDDFCFPFSFASFLLSVFLFRAKKQNKREDTDIFFYNLIFHIRYEH